MPAVVTASPLLLVTVELDPWRLSFGVLDQAFPAGFSSETRWDGGPSREMVQDPPEPAWHELTRVREERLDEPDAYEAVVDTAHPDGRTATVRVSLVEDASLRVSIAVEHAAILSQAFVARPDERYLGFGERSHLVSLGEGVIENYVGEGPYQPHEYPFLTDTVPAWGIRDRPDATYFPVPWILSTRGYGVLIEQDDLSYFRVRPAGPTWSVEVEADHLCFRVFPGPTPLEALQRFSAATGRQPAPERWFFGPWYQSGHANHVPLEEERRQIEVLSDAPASAVETHCRYLPLGEDRGHEESERARTAQFHSAGVAALSYMNPLVGVDYAEAFSAAEDLDALQRHADGRPYVFQAYVGGREPPYTQESQYDFTNPDAVACWLEVADRVVQAGYDGWMEDFGEYTPLDAVMWDGSAGPAAHNRYPTEYHLAATVAARVLERRYERRLARFVRSGWTGTAPAAPIVWGGDPTTSWGFDGLASAVMEGLTMGASGVAMWGSDIGGFLSTLDRLTPDLLRRWIQFAAFTPVMRTKAGGIEIPAYRRPQIWDSDVLPTWRRYARWHMALNDYLIAAHAEYGATGRPIMCAMELAHPASGPSDDQYLLGPDLLVAPILEPDAVSRSVWVPDGEWIYLFDPRRRYVGPGRVDVATGEDIPVLVRAGAALGLLPESVVSLSPYAAELPDRRTILAFPGPSWNGRLGPDVSARAEWIGERWRMELSSPSPFTYDVQVWLQGDPPRQEVCTVSGREAVVEVS